jgi:two-component sensor histidine kinase
MAKKQNDIYESGGFLMKIYAKRDKYSYLEKVKLVFEDTKEWSLLSGALRLAIENERKMLDSFTEMTTSTISQEEKEKYLRDIQDRLDKYKKAYDELEVQNEIEWDGK